MIASNSYSKTLNFKRHFPVSEKKVDVALIHKNEEKNLIKNYCPVLLLPYYLNIS